MTRQSGEDATLVFAHIPEIAEKYDGFERLSEGGQGMIYRARHRFLDEVRVIKTIHSTTEFEDAQERFMREARIAAKLRHPNIATVHDFIVGPAQDAFLIMEYIDGTNLWELYRRKQRIKLAEVALLAHQVLDALDYLHKQNFVHRDIALDNVMMTQDARGQVVFKPDRSRHRKVARQ